VQQIRIFMHSFVAYTKNTVILFLRTAAAFLVDAVNKYFRDIKIHHYYTILVIRGYVATSLVTRVLTAAHA
jgi:hypothetical protein